MDWASAKPRAAPIRLRVFVEEQRVPAEIELDEWDAQSEHAIAFDSDGRAVGTGRLLPDGHIGRMAVLAHCRGRGVGRLVLETLMARAKARGMATAVLNAQMLAVPFYTKSGFTARGPVFMEAGIEHIEMYLAL